MGISAYLKTIVRGARGAGALEREQARDLLGQVLDGRCSSLEIGAFCAAMRIKGETARELAGFLDAVQPRLARVPGADRPAVVLPCYNGGRKLPPLTPLLALLLARKGLPVLAHGAPSEDGRVTSQDVLALLGVPPHPAGQALRSGQVHFAPTQTLQPGLYDLLQARRATGLRNPAHTLVKMMNPVDGPALVVCCHTHPAYFESMSAALELTGSRAMLLRGAEGEPAADPRRAPRMDVFLHGAVYPVQERQASDLASSAPVFAGEIDAEATAVHILAALSGKAPVPQPILLQVEHIVRACKIIEAEDDPSCLQDLTP
jgi:anthranilate phosphoribosyltransferase